MRFIVGLLVLLLVSCSQKQITFDIQYDLDEGDFTLIDDVITITDLPLYFQSTVENNYSKKSLIKEISLIEVCADRSIQLRKMDVLKNNQWNNIVINKHQVVKESDDCLQLIDSKDDFKEVFQQDKLNLRLTIKKGSTPKQLKLKFRFTGKYEKTNVQYRIIA